MKEGCAEEKTHRRWIARECGMKEGEASVIGEKKSLKRYFDPFCSPPLTAGDTLVAGFGKPVALTGTHLTNKDHAIHMDMRQTVLL